MFEKFKSIGSLLGPLLALVGVVAIFAIADLWFADGTFATVRNFRTVTVQTCVVAIAALGMTVIIIAGGIDLSAGTTLALCATMLAWGLREDVACRLRFGDSFASASNKLEAAQKKLATATTDRDRTATQAAVQKLRERLLAIAREKQAVAQQPTDAANPDAASVERSRKAVERWEQRIAQLQDVSFVVRADASWTEGVSNSAWSAPIAVALALVTGLLAGLLNGALISGLRVVPFIVSLGTMTIFLGVGNLVSNNTPIRPALDQIPAWIGNITKNTPDALIGGFPSGVWCVALLAVVLAVILRYTVFGRYLFAIGSNEATARLCGINVAFYKMSIYALAGLFFAVAGVCQFSRLTSGNPMSGAGLELEIIAAVVIGGASLNGGRGTVLGTLAGAATMAVIRSGCTQLGVADPVQRIILGAIIIGAVTVDQIRQRRLAA